MYGRQTFYSRNVNCCETAVVWSGVTPGRHQVPADWPMVRLVVIQAHSKTQDLLQPLSRLNIKSGCHTFAKTPMLRWDIPVRRAIQHPQTHRTQWKKLVFSQVIVLTLVWGLGLCHRPWCVCVFWFHQYNCSDFSSLCPATETHFSSSFKNCTLAKA